MDQVNALGASKFESLTRNEVKGEKNNFTVETKISRLSSVFSLVEVTVAYKENGREVSVPLAMLVEN